MAEPNSPDPTQLQDLPKRFWTPEVAKIALQQGHNRLVEEMVRHLLSQTPTTKEELLHQMLREAERALVLEGRTARYKKVLHQLNTCLKKARKLRKERGSLMESPDIPPSTAPCSS